MHENRFNEYRIPSGMLVVFLEKALTLIHMETHLDDVSDTFRLDLDRFNGRESQLAIIWRRTNSRGLTNILGYGRRARNRERFVSKIVV